MTLPAAGAETDTDAVTSEDTPWVTIVWNDPVNLMSYVTYVFQTLLGHPRPTAHKLMLDVHQKGRATVAGGTRDAMESVATQLHAAGLWATIAQDR
jgi:ATP-dependent Clp protease adaptor protein ClpS